MDNEQLLDIYSDYLIVQNQHATAIGLSELMQGHISHDKITKFLRGKESTSKELWQYVKPDVRKIEQNNGGVIIIDDVIAEKPYTDENEIISWHYSHAKGMTVKGINIVSGLVRYGDITLPIGYEIVHKDVHYCDIATKKEKRQSSINKNQMLRSIISQAVVNGVKFDYVLFDSWYSAKKNLEFIHYEIKKKFVGGIKANRVVAVSEDDKKKGKYQNLSSLNLKDGEKRIVYLKDVAFPVALIKKIFKNEDGSTGVLYLITNDLESDAEKIYQIYQKRWKIEEYHKSIKQNASLEKSPTKVPRTQKNHIFSSIVAYCKLELLSTKSSMNHFAFKYMLLMQANRAAFLELGKLRYHFTFA